MGSVCSCCLNNQGDYTGFSNDQAEDQKSLLKKEDRNSDSIIQVSTTPTPLLQDINFAAIDDNEDNKEDTATTSIDEEKIEELLAEEEEEHQATTK